MGPGGGCMAAHLRPALHRQRDTHGVCGEDTGPRAAAAADHCGRQRSLPLLGARSREPPLHLLTHPNPMLRGLAKISVPAQGQILHPMKASLLPACSCKICRSRMCHVTHSELLCRPDLLHARPLVCHSVTFAEQVHGNLISAAC